MVWEDGEDDTVVHGDTDTIDNLDDPGDREGLVDDIEREAESVSWLSWPVLARIDGWPNLLPTDECRDTLNPDEGEDINIGTEDVSGPNCPVLANIDGFPNLLPP